MDTLRSDLDNYLTSKINRTRYNNPDMLRFGFRENEGYGLSDIYVEAFLRQSFESELGDDPERKLRDFENTLIERQSFKSHSILQKVLF